MSSPSKNSPEQSVSVYLPSAADGTIEDSASSAQRMGPPPGVLVQFVFVPPNVAFHSRLANVRLRFALPQPHRTATPTNLSVAQRHAWTAELKAESAYSGVGVVAD